MIWGKKGGREKREELFSTADTPRPRQGIMISGACIVTLLINSYALFPRQNTKVYIHNIHRPSLSTFISLHSGHPPRYLSLKVNERTQHMRVTASHVWHIWDISAPPGQVQVRSYHRQTRRGVEGEREGFTRLVRVYEGTKEIERR
jgi:hypothetical protein